MPEKNTCESNYPIKNWLKRKTTIHPAFFSELPLLDPHEESDHAHVDSPRRPDRAVPHARSAAVHDRQLCGGLADRHDLAAHLADPRRNGRVLRPPDSGQLQLHVGQQV